MLSKPHHKHEALFAAGYFLLMITLGVMGFMVLKNIDSLVPRDPVPVHGPHGDLAYYKLPRMTVVVGTGANSARVKLDITIEVDAKDVPIIEGFQPRITDRLNAYLGKLSADQIERPSSTPWLRTEILREINSAGAPIPVKDLMFRRLVVM